MNLPKRKPTRLKRYDYSAPGAYFITICTQNRKQILSKISIVGEGLRALPKNELTKTGNVVKNAVDFINKVYQNISVDKYVIMPNHVHLLISITGGHGEPPLRRNDALHHFFFIAFSKISTVSADIFSVACV